MSGHPGWVKHGETPAAAAPATTDGTLLGGRVRYRQFAGFHRTGLEPVLLAAAVPARPGQRVLEAGCGAGAGLLCLGARVPGLRGVGIEQDADMAALARGNLSANGLDWPVLATPLAEASSSEVASPHSFHHAFANPPWHRAGATRSPDPKRDLARRAPDGMLDGWTGALAALLRPRGTLTLALPAALHAQAAAALLATGFGDVRLLPLWPRPGRAARIVLLRGVLGGRGGSAVLPGLVLHGTGGFTAAADAVLRGGEALGFGEDGRRPGRRPGPAGA